MLFLDLVLPGAPSFTSKPSFEIAAFSIISARIQLILSSLFPVDLFQNASQACALDSRIFRRSGMNGCRVRHRLCNSANTSFSSPHYGSCHSPVRTYRNSRGHRHVFEIWPCHDTLLRTAPKSVAIASFCNIVRCSPELIMGYALCDSVGTGARSPRLHTTTSAVSI